ncbi:Protein orai-2 [Dermatophagoides pteronyssinus]|uniref:Protein orai-2 n=1 Tax=Dermatophagoides pteronyssinus TaxID=6956 RepID=A0ABQ8JBS8_DERPT|nr:Protein orai-2 [Dermatophagoides pteronyssinus]
MLNTINADDNNDNNVGGGNKSNPNDKTSSNVSSKSTTTAAAQNVKNLTSKLLLRSTLLGSMSSLSRHSNQRSPSPAQLFMQQHQHQQQQQQQQQQQHHQQQQQLQQQQLQQLQQQILEKPSSITWPQSTVQHSTQTTTSFAIGMSTMFSSPSLLALPQPPPSINYQSNSMSRSYQERLDNSVLNTNEKPYLSAKKSPFRKHPLIEITRTRALSRAKLKQSSQVSALLSGFALVAMVEMDIQTPSTIPLSVLMFFITVTTMLVSVHMIALMISTCILPHIESMNAMQDLALTLGTNDNPIINFSDHDETIVTPSGIIPLINDNHIASTVKETNVADQLMSDASIYYGTTPHQKMSRYISIAWFFSTVIGIFLFMLELVAIVWVKFWDHHRDTNEQIGGGQNDNKNNININNNNNNNNQWLSDGKFVAIVASLILIPVLLALIFFAYHFYRKLVLIKWELTQKVLDELNNIADGLSAGEHI